MNSRVHKEPYERVRGLLSIQRAYGQWAPEPPAAAAGVSCRASGFKVQFAGGFATSSRCGGDGRRWSFTPNGKARPMASRPSISAQ